MRVTYRQILELSPYFKPKKLGMMTDYSATVSEFIKDYRNKVIRARDLYWVVCNDKFLTKKELRLYAVWCARQVQHLMKDQRSIDALDIAEKYANGEVTVEDLKDTDGYAAAYAAFRVATSPSDDHFATSSAAYAADAAAYAADPSEDLTFSSVYSAAHANSVYDADTKNIYVDYIDKLLEIFEGKENELL